MEGTPQECRTRGARGRDALFGMRAYKLRAREGTRGDLTSSALSKVGKSCHQRWPAILRSGRPQHCECICFPPRLMTTPLASSVTSPSHTPSAAMAAISKGLHFNADATAHCSTLPHLTNRNSRRPAPCAGASAAAAQTYWWFKGFLHGRVSWAPLGGLNEGYSLCVSLM